MSEGVDLKKRRFLSRATTVVGAVGVGFVTIPFLSTFKPSARAQAAGAPVEVDISKIEDGQLLTIEWRGKPVWIVKRTPEILGNLPSLDDSLRDPSSEISSQQPEYARNEYRSIKPEILVLVGICTHLGCSPTFRPDLAPADLGEGWKGGFFCPCHGSKFDLAGRVFKGVPAPKNLQVPPYRFIGDHRIVIGEDQEGAA